jgi:hypothetical protein
MRRTFLVLALIVAGCASKGPDTIDLGGYSAIPLNLPWQSGNVAVGLYGASATIPAVLSLKGSNDGGRARLCAQLSTTATDQGALQYLAHWKDAAAIDAGGTPITSLAFADGPNGEVRCTTTAVAFGDVQGRQLRVTWTAFSFREY